MKKSTIWLLAIIMALTFTSLLFMQITYIENMVRMRNEQFSEAVKRSLYAVSSQLEQDETKRYLAEDIEESKTFALDRKRRNVGYATVVDRLGRRVDKYPQCTGIHLFPPRESYRTQNQQRKFHHQHI